MAHSTWSAVQQRATWLAVGLAAVLLFVVPQAAAAESLDVANVQVTNAAGVTSVGVPVLKVDLGGSKSFAVEFDVTTANVQDVHIVLGNTITTCGVCSASNVSGNRYRVSFDLAQTAFSGSSAGDVNVNIMFGAKKNGTGQLLTKIHTSAFIVDTTAPAAVEVTAPAAGVRVKQATVAWNTAYDVSGIAGYVVSASNQAGKTFNKTVAESATTFDSDDFGFDGDLTVTVQAKDNAGRISAAASRSFVLDSTAPAVPTDVLGKVSKQVTELSWKASADSALFRVYRDGKEIAQIDTASYTDVVDNVSLNYTYTVTAADDLGNVSAASAGYTTTAVAPEGALAAPSGLTAAVKKDATTLQWSGVSGAAVYRVYRDGVKVGETSTTTYVDAVDNVGKSYTYTVSTVDVSGKEGGKSAPLTTAALQPETPPATNEPVTPPPAIVEPTPLPVVTPPPATNQLVTPQPKPATSLLPAPTGLKASVTATTTTLTWNAVNGAVRYHLYQNGRLVGPTNTARYVHGVDNVEKKYEYFVKAVDVNGKEGKASVTIATLGVTPAGAPIAPRSSSTPAAEETTTTEETPAEIVATPPPVVTLPLVTTNSAVNAATVGLGVDAQASAFGAADLFTAWWFWLIILAIVIAGGTYLYYRSRDEEEQTSTVAPA